MFRIFFGHQMIGCFWNLFRQKILKKVPNQWKHFLPVLLELKKVELPLFTFADRTTGRRVMLNYSGAPYLTLWSDGGPFLCVEPCWGLPDHEAQRPFEEKLGIQEIEPLGTLTRSFTLAPFLI